MTAFALLVIRLWNAVRASNNGDIVYVANFSGFAGGEGGMLLEEFDGGVDALRDIEMGILVGHCDRIG